MDKFKGLYEKYKVTRLNDEKNKHENCWFFVLDIRHDPIARTALREYALNAHTNGYAGLARDLLKKLDDIRLSP